MDTKARRIIIEKSIVRTIGGVGDGNKRKNILKCLQTKRILLLQIFNEKEDAMTHLTKFERIINELRAAGEEIKESDIIGNFMLSLPETYDNKVNYFEGLSHRWIKR